MGIVSHSSSKIPRGPVIAGLLFLLLTLPLAIFFVSQQQQLADLRKRAAEEGAYPTLPAGTACNPGTFDNAGTDAEVICDTACGVHGGRMCNSSGTGYGGCQTSLHACGATSTSECNTTADCAARGYGSNVTCNITNHRCVGQSGRYFIGCGGPNDCYNCYEGSDDASKNGCFKEATSCGQKSICQTQPTPSEIAQLITTQPPSGGGGGNTPTPTRPPGATPTNTPIDTPTNTPIDTPTNTPIDTPTNTPIDTPTNTPTGTPGNTPTNTPTGTPGPTPTATPSPSPAPGCNYTCVVNTDCSSAYVCWEGYCRNASCVENSNCVCAGATPTPTTPTTPNIPVSGAGPTAIGASILGGGFFLLLLGFLL